MEVDTAREKTNDDRPGRARPARLSGPMRLPGVVRPMLYLAAPVFVEQLLSLAVGYTDWWLTGHYLEGPAYKAAMGLMSYVMWLLPSMFAAVAIGATALVARHAGAGEHGRASRTANQAMLSGIALAVVMTAVSFAAAPSFVVVMRLESGAGGHALSYLLIVLPAVPAIMVEEVASACLRGAGDTLTGMAAKAVVVVVNIFVSASLVTGWGPFPELGWRGLAVGTCAGHLTGGVILLTVLVVGRAGLRLKVSQMRPDFGVIRRLMRIGLPGGLDIAAVLGCQFVFAAIIFGLGNVQAAAHGLGVQIEALAYLPGNAFQVAAATMAGQYLGARDPRRAVRGVLASLAAGGAFMTGAGLLFFFGGEPVTRFFTGESDSETARLTVTLLKIVAVAMPSLAAVMILTGALRGAGDTRWPLIVTLIGFLGVRIPLGYVLAVDEMTLPFLGPLPGLGWGAAGAWCAMVADLVLRSLLVAARFLHGGWKRTAL